MTVAVRRNVHDHIDMEARTILTDSLSIFSHFAVEFFIGVPFDGLDGVKGAGTDAAAAALHSSWTI